MIKIKTNAKVLAPFLVLLATGLIAALMMHHGNTVKKAPAAESIRQVTAIAIKQQSVHFPVKTQGVVQPLTKIRFLSEVSGKIIWVAPNWHDGGLFKKGDILLKVEDFYYQSELDKAKANLKKAETMLIQERAAAHVAKKTWESSGHKNDDAAARELALREPQLATAEAAMVSAQTTVDAAQKMVDKTILKAPFTGILDKRTVDIGQVVGQGQQLAEFYGIAKAKIRVPLTQEQQTYLQLPQLGEKSAIETDVIDSALGQQTHFLGQLVRTSGILDENTRVLHAVIEVDDPYRLNSEQGKRLLLGNFVEVDIVSQEQQHVVVLPYHLLRPGNQIWVADKDNKLRKRSVELFPSPENLIYVKQGFEPGDRIIIGSIVDAYPGSLVEVTMQDGVELK